MLDQSGNGNKETDFIAYNCLELTSSETAETSGFLGETSIQRQNIEKVVFVNNTSGSTATGVKKVWDASAAGDNTIKAWYSQTSAPYTVYIGSDDEIFANQNSSYLFSYIGYASTATATEAITSINLLNTNSVTDMSYMFNYCGYTAMTKLDLGSNFDTSNVTSMYAMFYACGYTAMTTLDFGDLFATSNVTNMFSMFNKCGYTAMTSLDLGATGVTFDTSKVTITSQMFWECGYTAMTSLNLGTLFDTGIVTSMYGMFYQTGYTAMTSLNLGSLFDTGIVTDMSAMFYQTGYTAMTSLNLGTLFDTGSVTTMYCMFYECGYTAMTSLNLGNLFDTSSVTDMTAMFCKTGYTAMTSLNLGSLFNTSSVTSMVSMFDECGYTALTSLDLGDLFYTTAVTDMSNMFAGCGNTAMTTLDLGPAFTKIASTNTGFITNTGKSGACVIYAPESIYKNRTSFKLNSTDTTNTITYANGTINPIYRPEWEKVSSTIDTTAQSLAVTVKGFAYESQTIDSNVNINYASDVTSTLSATDIKVFIDGTDITDVTLEAVSAGTTSTNATSGKTEITHTITLSNFEEATRRAGIPYKEWSGNVSIQILGRGEATSTYTANVLTDVYGNQSMMATDEVNGTWIDVTYEDADINLNTDGTMFVDYIKPEFTYKWSDTTIGNGATGDETLTVVFDITDKYFDSSTIIENKDNITVAMLDDATAAVNTAVEKELTKKTISADVTDANGLTYKTNGDIYYNGTKVGERYELVISDFDQGAGFSYSGPMSITFPASIATDTSNNSNNATTITIGINEDDGNPGTTPDADKGYDQGSQEIVDVVDPVFKSKNLVIGLDASGRTTATVDIIATDKYFGESTLTLDDIQLILAGEDISTKAPELVRTLSDPAYIKWDSATETYVTSTEEEANGVKYELKISNLEETYETFLAAREKYENDEDGGRVYREYSGPASIYIPASTTTNPILVDEYGNMSNAFTIDLGTIDTLKPEVVKVSSERVIDATNVENSKLVVTFDVTDKYLATSGISTTDVSKIHVFVDGTEATSITKRITNVETFTATINGVEGQLVGYRYTLELTDFENPRTSAVYGEYTEWSGEVTIKVDAATATDSNGTSNALTTIGELQGTHEDFVDFIKPDVTYKYTESSQATAGDIDYSGKTFKMVFEITDEYFANSTLTIDDLTILIDDETPNWRAAGGSSGVSKDLTSTDVTASVNGSSKVIGKRYTLTLSNLEQLEKLAGQEYLDYSGVITVAIPQGKVTDTGPAGDGNNPNGNDATTITSGIEVKGEATVMLPFTEYTTPYLPTGYSYVEGDLDTGLVIADPLGNEYVWVEVPRNSTVYSADTLALDLDSLTGTDLSNACDAIETDLKTYTTDYSVSDYSDTYYSGTGLTETEYYELKDKMLKSVFLNGGFYVGRYETGITDSYRTSSSEDIADYTPVIQQNAYLYNNVTAAQSQTLASSFASGEYTSSLLFGVQWDLVLKHLENYGTSQSSIKAKACSWGNTYNNWMTIENVNLKYRPKNDSSWYTTTRFTTRTPGYYLSTGSTDLFSVQGIYDLAGNAREITLERYDSTSAVPRGSSCGGANDLGAWERYEYGVFDRLWLPCGPILGRWSIRTRIPNRRRSRPIMGKSKFISKRS